jgi:glycosyltransferase involved in cell wall biosynthesis
MSTPRKPLADATLLITGLTRDGETHIAREVAKLLEATKACRETHVLIVESDSTDGTLNMLAEMAAASPRFHYITLGHLQPTIPARAERLAHCRNAYIHELRDNPLYADVDYVIVSDLDGMNDQLNAASIASCWQIQQDWGVLTANQNGHYYDIWALRHPDWCPDDCLRLMARMEPLFGHELARDMAVYARQIRLPQNMPPITVVSAFGGLAVYTRQAMLSGGYEAYEPNGDEVCEHVPHHRKVRTAGHGIFINPRLINTGMTIHTRNKRPGKVIKNTIRALLRHWLDGWR